MSNESSADYHFVNEQLKEARRKNTELEQQLVKQNCNYEHSVAFCNKCGWMPPQAVRDQTAKLTERDKLLDECEKELNRMLRDYVAMRNTRSLNLLTKLRERTNVSNNKGD